MKKLSEQELLELKNSAELTSLGLNKITYSLNIPKLVDEILELRKKLKKLKN